MGTSCGEARQPGMKFNHLRNMPSPWSALLEVCARPCSASRGRARVGSIVGKRRDRLDGRAGRSGRSAWGGVSGENLEARMACCRGRLASGMSSGVGRWVREAGERDSAVIVRRTV